MFEDKTRFFLATTMPKGVELKKIIAGLVTLVTPGVLVGACEKIHNILLSASAENYLPEIFQTQSYFANKIIIFLLFADLKNKRNINQEKTKRTIK